MAEGTEVGTGYVSIVPSAAGFGAKLQSQITGEATTAGTAAGKALSTGVTTSAAGIAKSVGGLFAVIGTARFLRGSIAEAEEAVKVGNLSNAVIKSTGGIAGVTADQVEKLAGSLSKVAGVDDELIQAGENVLLTFTSVRNQVGAGNDVFDQATTAALDLSTALGGDLQGSIIQIGKALQDPTTGLLALRRSGVSFTQEQRAQIKVLQETGDLLGAQKIILGEINREFGGAAAANATSLDKLGVSVGNLKESLGTALLPAVNAAARGLGSMIGEVQDAPGPIRAMAGASLLLAGGITAASLAAGLLGPKIRNARTELAGFGEAGEKASGALGVIGRVGGILAIMEAVIQVSNLVTPKVKDLDEKVADLAATTDGKLNKAFHDSAEEMGKWDLIGARSLLPTKLKTEFDTFAKVLDAGNFALAQRVINSEGDLAVRARLQTAYDKAIGATRQLNADQALSGQIISGVGDAIEDTSAKIDEAKTKWDELRGALDNVIQGDWSKKLASNLTSALNPMEKFGASAAKTIADLKGSVTDATEELAKARADLAKLDGSQSGTAGDIAKIRGGGADLDSAREAVADAAKRLTDTQKDLAEAQKSPIASIRENLTANLKEIGGWLDNLTKLTTGGHEDLAKHLGALGPDAAKAVQEALGMSPKQLASLEGLFDQTDKRINEAASGAFELNLDQVAAPGKTMAEIIAKRYQDTLVAKLPSATLAALDVATATLLGIIGPLSINDPNEPGSGEARRPPQSAEPAGPVAPAPAPFTPPLINVPGFSLAPQAAPQITIPFQVTSTADPRAIAQEAGDHLAWRLAPKPTLVG